MTRIIIYIIMSLAVELLLIFSCLELEFPLLWIIPICWGLITILGLTDIPKD